MDTLFLEATENSPKVYFNAVSGVMLLSGRSYLYDNSTYLEIMVHWLRKNMLNGSKNKCHIFEIRLDVLDHPSHLMIHYLLEELNKYFIMGYQYEVLWIYQTHDDFLDAVGQELKELYDLPIKSVALV